MGKIRAALAEKGEKTRLHIRLLGGFAVTIGGALIPDDRWHSRRARNLVELLALAPGHRLHRDQVADTLWPGSDLAASANNFHQTLHAARGILGAGCLVLEEGYLHLACGEPAQPSVDVEQFEAAAARTRDNQDPQAYLAAIELYPGDLLPDDRYEEWVSERRETLRQAYLQLLLGLALVYEARGEYPAGIEALQRLLAIDKANEEAHVGLMRLYALSGHRQQALRQYQDLQEILRNDLEVEPSQDSARLYAEIQSGSFAPPSARERKRHNLPAALTAFIGRETEIERIAHLLQTSRLVTLTGAGGVGKTRLAQQVASSLLARYPDGVWLAELAPLSNPDLVPQIVARSIGLQEQPGPQATNLLLDYLAPRQMLLVLDNCEHLIDACARLADVLLSACPRLSLLVTSRELLDIAGETPFRVPSMTLPESIETYLHPRDGALPLPVEELRQSEAIRLFVARAEVVSPGFALTLENAQSVIQVCQRLDGIPLAIELAAARTRMLQVGEIAQRLDDRFRLLTGGSRTLLPRHQTLRASIDWSYDLLSPPERLLLQRLSVFAGGWALDAAEFACCREGTETLSTFDLVAQLVNKSLVIADLVPGQPTRYRLLETIRQYAYAKLEETGQAGFARDLHMQYYLQLAERVESNLRGPHQVQMLDLLETELDNIRLALDWSPERQDATGKTLEAGLRIAAALFYFWHPSYRHAEGLQWLERLLALEEIERGAQPASLERTKYRAKALYVAGWLANYVGLIPKSAQYMEESRILYQSLGPDGRLGLAYINTVLAQHHLSMINSSAATTLLEQSLAIFEQEGDLFGCSEALTTLGFAAEENFEYEKAGQYYDRQTKIKRELGDLDGIAGGYFYLGSLALVMGQDKQAQAAMEQSRKIFDQIHNLYIKFPLYILGILEEMKGNDAEAAEYFQEIVSIGRRRGNDVTISNGLVYLGMLAMAQDHFAEAEQRFEESLSIHRKHRIVLDVLWYPANLAWARDEFVRAGELFAEVLATGQENAQKSVQGDASFGLGRVALAQGRYDQARKYLLEALDTNPAFNKFNRGAIPYTLEAIAFVEVAQKNLIHAARLLGATHIYCERFKLLRTSKERALREAALAGVQAGLDPATFQAAWAAGMAMSMKEAVEFALREQKIS